MIGVIDSKICNIHSICNMLKKLNINFEIIENGNQFVELEKSLSKIIIPGVGAFPKAIENLEKFGLFENIIEFYNKNKPILGICLGMQLLFDESEEFGITKGFGFIPGKVVKIKTEKSLPHMGWNDIKIQNQSKIVENIRDGADFYFVHSYRAETDDKYIVAYTEYDEKIPAIVNNKNVFGTQFHPEKSMKWGEILLRNFSVL